MAAETSMQTELAQLEDERTRLLSMIAYQTPSRPPWVRGTMIGMISGIAFMSALAILSYQDSLSERIIGIVTLGLFGYLLTRKVTLFGIPILVFDVVTLSPRGAPAGEPEARQRLADCEARIMQLKAARQ